MFEIEFLAQEYHADGIHRSARYRYFGSDDEGWEISREGQRVQRLGPGYVPVRSRYCGICATDLARRHLPFPLPQIIGHEVIGEYQGRSVAMDINATHQTRRIHVHDCAWCAASLERHCPTRLTLGIDRLPGGFAPWLLVPKGGLHVLPDGFDPQAATLIEPLAAAMRALEVSPPEAGETIAVLGPRRLGMLLLAALAAERSRRGIDFEITAIVRRAEMVDLCREMGADAVMVGADHAGDAAFDTVFDTTGSPQGLADALRLARRRVHLKSTHGRAVMGLDHLSELVIDELSMGPAPWPGEDPATREAPLASGFPVHLLALPSVPATVLSLVRNGWPGIHCRQETLTRVAGQCLRDGLQGRYDVVVVSNLAEADAVIRPLPGQAVSLLRPGGRLLLAGEDADFPLVEAISRRGLLLQSSRCGDFTRAIALLDTDRGLLARLAEGLISHVYPVQRLNDAFAMAAESAQAIKVVVETADDGI